jgi:hypothetical protein
MPLLNSNLLIMGDTFKTFDKWSIFSFSGSFTKFQRITFFYKDTFLALIILIGIFFAIF